MTDTATSYGRHIVVATDDESLQRGIVSTERHGPLSAPGAAPIVIDVSHFGRLTSTTITELLSIARRSRCGIVVQGASRENLRLLARAGVEIDTVEPVEPRRRMDARR